MRSVKYKYLLFFLAIFLTSCASLTSKPVAKPTKKEMKNLFDSFFPKEVAETKITNDGIKIIIKNKILFDRNRYDLKPAAKNLLKKLAFIYNCRILPYYSNSKIIIVGHTDDTGTEDYNLKLSFKRAEAVATFLETLDIVGIDKTHIVYTGKGEKEPLVPNTNERNRSLNRRVEISIDLGVTTNAE